MLDEPEVPYHWGAEGAAVAFKRIATRIINMDDKIIPPNPKGKTLTEFKIKEENEFAKSVINNRDLIDLSTNGILTNKMKVPELRGVEFKKAIFTLNEKETEIQYQWKWKSNLAKPKTG